MLYMAGAVPPAPREVYRTNGFTPRTDGVGRVGVEPTAYLTYLIYSQAPSCHLGYLPKAAVAGIEPAPSPWGFGFQLPHCQTADQT